MDDLRERVAKALFDALQVHADDVGWDGRWTCACHHEGRQAEHLADAVLAAIDEHQVAEAVEKLRGQAP